MPRIEPHLSALIALKHLQVKIIRFSNPESLYIVNNLIKTVCTYLIFRFGSW